MTLNDIQLLNNGVNEVHFIYYPKSMSSTSQRHVRFIAPQEVNSPILGKDILLKGFDLGANEMRSFYLSGMKDIHHDKLGSLTPNELLELMVRAMKEQEKQAETQQPTEHPSQVCQAILDKTTTLLGIRQSILSKLNDEVEKDLNAFLSVFPNLILDKVRNNPKETCIKLTVTHKSIGVKPVEISDDSRNSSSLCVNFKNKDVSADKLAEKLKTHPFFKGIVICVETDFDTVVYFNFPN